MEADDEMLSSDDSYNSEPDNAAFSLRSILSPRLANDFLLLLPERRSGDNDSLVAVDMVSKVFNDFEGGNHDVN